ncbi:MAG: DUF6164 family protein [Methylomonas sp.]|jgi:hypothetical protein
MTVLFFSLRGVPADEAEDVRALLNAHDVEFYETPAGNWGLSMPAIWLYKEEDLEKIRPEFAAYQQQRRVEQRRLYQQLKTAGQPRRPFKKNLKKTIQLVVYVCLMLITIYISFKWLFELGLYKL